MTCLLISSSGTFGWSSVLRFFDDAWVVIMSSLGMVDRVVIFSIFSSRFIRKLTICSFVTCWIVNAVLVYLMKPLLASR